MVCQIEDSDVKKNTLSYVPHLTLPLSYLEPHSLSSLSPSSSSSLSLNTTLPLPLSHSPNHRFPTPATSSHPPPTRQNKTNPNETKPQAWGKQQPNILNSSFLLGGSLSLGDFILYPGILQNCPRALVLGLGLGGIHPCWNLADLVGSPC